MAKFDIKFIDCYEPQSFIQVEELTTEDYPEIKDESIINIYGCQDDGSRQREFVIFLDKSTAIKFAKTLRTEINKITAREEGNNE